MRAKSAAAAAQKQPDKARAANAAPSQGVAPTRRAKVSNDPLSRWSGNTSEGRRVRDLFRSLLVEAGSPESVAARAQVLEAAELVAASECARATLLRGDGKIDDVVRLSNLASRAVRRLQVRPVAADMSPGAALDAHLASLCAQATEPEPDTSP